MLGWLWKYLGWTKTDGLYSPQERLIYSYHDGEKVVRADPAVLYRRLMDVGPELSADIAVACSPMPVRAEATAKAEGKVRAIFGLKPFADGGLGEAEAYELLDHFAGYCDGVKKNLARLPIYFPSSAKPSPKGGSTTPPTSDCGSTASVPSTAEPAPSPTASKSPSDSTPETNTGTPCPADMERLCS